MKKLWDKIPPFLKNYYVLIGLIFLIWIFFFDRNDLVTHFRLSSTLDNLEKQEHFYKKKIKEVEKNREELKTDDEKLEKFAREKYLMKKDNEDLYIVEKDTEEDNND